MMKSKGFRGLMILFLSVLMLYISIPAMAGSEAKSLFEQGLKADIQENYKIAAKLYKKACDGGNAWGCNNLGNLYANGHGVQQNYFKAAKFYKKACDIEFAKGRFYNACNKLGTLYVNLGVLYAKGRGVQQNYSKAAKLYKKACDGGNALGCNNLGVLYERGRGVEQSYSKAAKLYKKACDGGNADGCHSLGVLYAKVCDGGNADGCYNLGVLYDNGGYVVQQDHSKAAKLYKKACNLGDATGCLNLGYLYAKGYGVSMNKFKAYKYWVKAAKQGNQQAQHNLDILCKQSPWACK